MKWVTRLYTLLLRLYPTRFRAEFAEEMTAVFVEALSDAQQRGRLSLFIRCGREFTGLLTALMQEQWRSLRWEEAVMNQALPVNHANGPNDARPEKPLAIIAGMIPFILFGLMFTLKGVNYHSSLPWMRREIYGDLIAHAILIVGLGVGWALRFPRWSYPYLSVVVATSLWLAGVVTADLRLFGYTFGRERWGWLGWAPLLALTAVMLLSTRSLQPFAQLLRDVRRDWTRLSFALYGALTWLLMGITYDGKTWYNQTLYLPLNMFLLTLVMTGGAFFYMRKRRLWPRVLALQAAVILFLPVSALVTTLDGQSEFGSPSTAAGWFGYLLLWLAWLSPPLWPGLASHLWRRFRPA